MSIISHQIGEKDDSLLTSVLITVRYQDQWLFVRRNGLDKLDMPEGLRAEGESIEDTARRVLSEQTGAVQYDIFPVCVFSDTETPETCGMLYHAIITEKGEPAADAGIAECILSYPLPRNMTRPPLQQPLFFKVQEWLNLRSNADEMWDVYTAEGIPTGRLHRRGDPLPAGDYHLGVAVWVFDSEGHILLTRRAPEKGNPMLWEIPGGAAQAGDDSLTAALREVWEETGIELDPDNGVLLLSLQSSNAFTHVWVFRQDVDLSQAQLLEGETCDIRLVTRTEFFDLRATDMFIPCHYLAKLFTYVDKKR